MDDLSRRRRARRRDRAGDRRCAAARVARRVRRPAEGARSAAAAAGRRTHPAAFAGPHPAVRPSRAGQDDAGDDRRARERTPAAPVAAVRRSSTPATWPRCCRASRRARCSSSTRCTAWPASAEEMLYLAMEDFRIDIMVGKGAGATSIPLDLAPFTLVGATTRSGLLPNPLRDRFGFTAHLEYYEPEELERVIERSAGMLGVDLPRAARAEIARRSRGTPRIANRLLRRVRDYRHRARPGSGRGHGRRRHRRRRAGPLRRRLDRPRPPRPRGARTCSSVGSAAVPSASTPSRWPSARSPRRSSRSSSPTSCGSASWAARRAVGSRCPRRTRTWACRTQRMPSDSMTYNR